MQLGTPLFTRAALRVLAEVTKAASRAGAVGQPAGPASHVGRLCLSGCASCSDIPQTLLAPSYLISGEAARILKKLLRKGP